MTQLRKQKLELTWIGKDIRPRLEPRILLEDPEKSYHSKFRVTSEDFYENMLIHGDNLLALKALEEKFTGKIKAIYIDPPFNTQQAFEHYDDSVEHSTWLSLIRDRVEILRRLLSDDGTFFVHIDDNELGYLIILLDEVFGRSNRVYVITFKQGSATGHKAINPGCVSTTNYILIYAKDKSSWTPNKVFTSRNRDTRYAQFIENVEEDYTQWKLTSLVNAFCKSVNMTEKDARKKIKENPSLLDDFVTRNAQSVIRLAKPDYDGVSGEARKLINESKENPNKILRLPRKDYSDIYLIGGDRILFYSDKLKLIDDKWVSGEPLTTLWDDILSNNLHAEGGVVFPKGKKPEGLIKRLLELSTHKGDWVMDSFAGSGTTGAVAQKMGRHWIMVELGDHCHTLIRPRLNSLIDGNDHSGVTKVVEWKGGGGYRFFQLAPSLLEKDKWGNWIISKEYNSPMLAQAVCKLMGYTYSPSESLYWQHGYSSERDFIYVTTATLNHDQLIQLSEEVGSDRALLVVCSSFKGSKEGYVNITVKKIPRAILTRCEWGKDDYSLKIENLPKSPQKPRQQSFIDVEEEQ